MNTEYIIVLITTASIEEGRKISQALLEKKQAACVNIVPGVSSSFWWEGKLDSAQESLLIVKTKATLLDGLIDSVEKLHSYSVPEIIALPIVGGNPDYLDWIEESLK